MIDHVSIAVRDLAGCGRFYEKVLAPLGYARLVTRPATIGFGKKYPEFWLNGRLDMTRPATIGFGKKYPEFWLNERRNMTPVDPDTGTHICLRASNEEAIRAFHDAAVQGGGRSDGAPGSRAGTIGGYYAAFIRDPEGNKIEAATFSAPKS